MSIYGDGKHIFTISLGGTAKTNSVLQDKLAKNGSNSMLGSINMSNSNVNNVSNPAANDDGATKAYVDNNILNAISRIGDTMQGGLAMSGNRINGLGDPISLQDCATKTFVDGLGTPNFIVVTGIMSNVPNTEIYLYTAPSNISINNSKMWCINLRMERNASAGELFISSSPGFKSQWTNFSLYSRDNLIMASFTGAPNGWSRRYIIHIFQFPRIKLY